MSMSSSCRLMVFSPAAVMSPPNKYERAKMVWREALSTSLQEIGMRPDAAQIQQYFDNLSSLPEMEVRESLTTVDFDHCSKALVI